MSSRYSDDYHSRKGSRTTKEEAGRSRSRSRSRSSSPSSSSPPSPDRQNKYRSKNEHELTHAAAEKTRSNSRGTSTGTRSTDVQLNGNNRTNSEHISRHRHDRHRDGKDESKGSNSVVCPPPPIISKVSMSFGKKPVGPAKPVQMKLSTAKPSDTVKKLTVAKAFSTNDSSEDEVEEMPAECRMRMRNIGRDTPTSSGPNSFGKTKQGFCDAKKIFEKNLRECSYD